jgi:type IV pilus assembly protein PilO
MKFTAPKLSSLSGKGLGKGLALPEVPKLDFAAIVDEFRYLDARDIGNWPRYPRVTALLGLLIGLLLAGWWFDWSAQLEELDTKQKQEATLKDEFLSKKKQSVNLEEYRKQLAEIDRSFGTLLKQLPNKEGMESLLIDINQAGLGRGLQFELFRPGNETPKDFYAELPIQLRVTGSYHDLGQFAGDVAKLSRIVTLTDLSLSAGQGGVLNLDAVATTYRYLDAEEMAKLRPAKGKGGK